VTYRVILQPRAEGDIFAAADWIHAESKSSAIALRWVRGLRAKIASLSSKPQRCPIDPDSDAYGEEVRVLLHGKRHRKYRILFAIRGNVVHVLTVRHSARQSLAEEHGDDPEDEANPVH
jgi:plasmid stabilization system protein ParE